MSQLASHLLMIKPVRFQFNDQTSTTNAFQQHDTTIDYSQDRALKEFNDMVRILHDNKLHVLLYEDTAEPHTPDSIFPNNWFSTEENGLLVLYPMFAENRRLERRPEIIQSLSERYQLHDIIDLTRFEKDEKYLEGTGSMVLDHDSRICYACYSPRTDKDVLKEFGNVMGYEIIGFDAVDQNGMPIYHTNVLMSVGESYMLICAEAIKDNYQLQSIIQSTSKTIIEISLKQMNAFAGNILEVINADRERLILMSASAYEALQPLQITELEKNARILKFPIPTIEQLGGGSVRCMIAEIFLPVK
jgi:hypothetical protein